MDATTLTAGAALGATLLLVVHEVWRLRTYEDPDAIWRAGFATLVATVAVSGAMAAQGSATAAGVRGVGVLLGTPVLLRVLGMTIDERPPRWLQRSLALFALATVPVVFGTDLYVTGRLTGAGTPELGPWFRALSIPPIAATAAWSLHVVPRCTSRIDQAVLALGIGLPSITSALLLLAPSGRDGLWVLILSPLLIATEIARWRHVRADLLRRERITRHRAVLARELTETNAQLHAALHTRSELLAATSHELRTPLTAVLGFTETLLEQDDHIPDEDRLAYLEVLRKNAERLGHLVDEMLAARSLRGGDVPRTRAPVALRPVLEGTASMFAELDSHLVLRCPRDLVVDADATHLHRILAALLDNAVLHGRPPVRVRAAPVGDAVEVVVEDAGPGLDAELAVRAFEPFVQGSSGPGRRTGGIGLGLSNAAALAELGGGSLTWATTGAEGVGAFVLTMPGGAGLTPVRDERPEGRDPMLS